MAKVTVRVTEEDVESAAGGGEFELPPQGFYVAEMVACEAGYKKVNGEEDKNAPRIECTYKLLGSGKEGKPFPKGTNYGQFWDYVTFSEAAGWKRAEFLKAMGLPVPDKGGEFEFDTDDGVGKKVIVRIKHERDNRADDGSKRGRISNVYPFVDGDADEAFGAASSADDDDEDDAFGTTDDGGDQDSDDDELLTEESLAEMDLKELGEIAKDFDLDPKDSIVKVRGKTNADKTKAKIIEVILEAQAADELRDSAGDDEVDDYDPF